MQAALQSRAPIVWLGGCEPLWHPNIADVVSALLANGHYVFLYTSGVGLRRRIHEFQPVPRFYLAFEMPLRSSDSTDSANSPDSSMSMQGVAECVRAARLSGFYVCGHFTVGDEDSPGQVGARIQGFSAQHLDGLAISSRGIGAASEFPALSPARLAEFTRLIPSRAWRAFSQILESWYRRRASSREFAASSSRAETACEESA